MSVYIKGMEMPKPKFSDIATVYDAYVLVSLNGHATIVIDDEDGLDSKEYPLVHVPEHGRLIDADALLGTERETFEDYHISEAPTIIPADNEGEG